MSNLQKDEEMLLPWLSEEQVERCKDGLKGRWQQMKLMYKLKQEDSNIQGYSYRQITAIPICPMCYKELGHMLTSDTKFCPFCGAQIELNGITSIYLDAFEFNGEYLLKHNDIVIERE